ncbi:MAG TPA: tripartite tricarboxylate transporter substrate binding protein [Ramlibacter sp.]|nr:tripartite tricarboxylate transporter substrate binding protein [Ramlibacter sp.]
MKRLLQILLLAASLVPAIGNAQTYPSRTVTIVVPFPPGGSNDTLARFLADQLGKQWNQPVIVENRPGGGSAIGAAYVAKSPPDGHRMVLVSSSYTTNAATKSELGFDPLKDLVPVSMVARGHVAVVAGSRLPLNSLADLAREAKGKTVFYGTAGIGSSQHFNAELLNDAMGIKMTAVPYKGGQEALLDLAAGRIDIVVGTLGGLLGYINSGKAKPLAVLSKARSPAAPNLPTAAEQGFPNALTDNYFAVFVPAGTPDAIVTKINQTIRTVTHTPEGRAFLTKVDGEPTELSSQEVSANVKKEIEYWTRLARKLNISEK